MTAVCFLNTDFIFERLQDDKKMPAKQMLA